MSRYENELVRLIKKLEICDDFKKAIKEIVKSKMSLRRKMNLFRKIFGVRVL